MKPVQFESHIDGVELVACSDCSESVDYHLIPSGHYLGVPVASDVWFALLHHCCRDVTFFLLLLLILPFYSLCEVVERILWVLCICSFRASLAALSAFSLHVIPTCPGTQSNVIFPPCRSINGLRGFRLFSVRNGHHCTQRVHDYHLRSFFFPCSVYSVSDRRLFRAIY
jgi:hypothetical protein